MAIAPKDHAVHFALVANAALINVEVVILCSLFQRP